jgi:hypothetical protein
MEEITEFKDKCMIIRVRDESVHIRGSLYESVRRCWRANLDSAKKADYVLAIVGNSEVRGVFKPTSWDYIDSEFCKKEAKASRECKGKFDVNTELCKKRNRIGFVGEAIKDDKKYLNKLVPEKYFPRQMPVRYTY